MSKYIHVDGDDGGMFVSDEQKTVTDETAGWFLNGWVYKVPDDFEIVIPLSKMGNHINIYELLEDHDRAELVFQG